MIDYKTVVFHPNFILPSVRFLESLEPFYRHRRFAMRLSSSSRGQPAKYGFRLQAAINPYFAIKVSKITVHAADFLIDCKIVDFTQTLYCPLCVLGVLRTFYRHRRFAMRLFSSSRVSLAKGCLRLQAAIRLPFAIKVSKAGAHAAGF